MPSSDTQFKKGEGGRPKGVKNKQTRDIKAIIQQILECSTKERVQKAIEELWDKESRTMIAFLAKIAPKSLKVEGGNHIADITREQIHEMYVKMKEQEDKKDAV